MPPRRGLRTAQQAEGWVPPPANYSSGVMAKYARLVGSGDLGVLVRAEDEGRIEQGRVRAEENPLPRDGAQELPDRRQVREAARHLGVEVVRLPRDQRAFEVGKAQAGVRDDDRQAAMPPRDPEEVLIPIRSVVVDLDRPAMVGEDLEQGRDLRTAGVPCGPLRVDLDPDDAGCVAPAAELIA